MKKLVGPRLAFALRNRLNIENVLKSVVNDVKISVVESDNKDEFDGKTVLIFWLSCLRLGAETIQQLFGKAKASLGRTRPGLWEVFLC